MPRPVADEFQQIVRLAENIEQGAQHVEIRAPVAQPLVLRADVVRLARDPFVQYLIDAVAVVVHMQPVAHLLAVAVDRDIRAVQRVRDRDGEQLLRVLIAGRRCSSRA